VVDNRLPAPSRNDPLDYNLEPCCGVALSVVGATPCRSSTRKIDKPYSLCEVLHMPSNLSIDDKLLEKALKIGRGRTKKDTVNEALREYIVKREQRKASDLFGTIDYFDDDGPKKYRRK